LILIEEPESQLHPYAQLMMAFWLYKLASENKVIITTHSPVPLSALVLLHEGIRRGRDPCKLLTVEGCKELELSNSLKIYYFNKLEDGSVRIEERKVEDLVKRGLDSITDVVRRISSWFAGVEVVP